MADSASSSISDDSLCNDITLLLECLKVQKDSLTSQKQALTTLGVMCSRGTSNVKELFRTGGCLDYVIQLIKGTQSMDIVQAGLCTLGCATEGNINTQLRLCDKDMFHLLHAVLRSTKPSLSLKSSVVCLLINIINNNIKGQQMAKDTKILSKLIDLFKVSVPSANDVNNILVMDYWTNICKCLSCASDNPQNELNQEQVSSVFPIAVSILQSNEQMLSIIKPVLNLLTSCVANNCKTQDRLHMVGGVRTLIVLLKTLLQSEEGSHQQDKISTVVSIIQTLFTVASNNSTITQYLASFKLVPILLNLLTTTSCNSFNSYHYLSIITCLETLVENNNDHQRQLIEGGGESALIDVMAESMDESICKAIPIIIKICKRRDDTNQCITAGAIERDEMLPPDCYIDLTREGSIEEFADVVKELDSTRIPLETKINNWLESTVDTPHEKSCDNTCTVSGIDQIKKDERKDSINTCTSTHLLGTNNREEIPVENSTNGAMQGVIPSKSANIISDTASEADDSEGLHNRMNELEFQLAQEREKRLLIENELQNIKQTPSSISHNVFKKPSIRPHKITERREPLRNTHTNIRDNTPMTSTPKLQTSTLVSSNSVLNTKLLTTPTRPKHTLERANLFHNYTQPILSIKGSIALQSNRPSSTNTTINSHYATSTINDIQLCPGCHGTVPLLNSRTFLTRLSTSSYTCTYHRKIVESMFMKKPLDLPITCTDSTCINTCTNECTDGVIQSDVHTEEVSYLTSQSDDNNMITSSTCNELTTKTNPERPLNTSSHPLNTSSHPLNTSSHPLNTSSHPLNTSSRLLTSNTSSCPLATTSRPLITTSRPLKSFTMSPIHPSVLRPLDNIINKQIKKQRVYDYGIPGGHTNKQKKSKLGKVRQAPLYFTEEEVRYLCKGVQKVGPRWKHILNAYPFQEGRTATSLKDKYRLLNKY